MTAFQNPLLDGQLSLKVGGTRNAVTGVISGGTELFGSLTTPPPEALQFSSKLQGGFAGCSWTMDFGPNVLNVASVLPALVHKAPVILKHGTQVLFDGEVLNDPSLGAAGETGIVSVECGGIGELAMKASDFALGLLDTQYDGWQVHRASSQAGNVDTQGQISLCFPAGCTLKAGDSVWCFYWLHNGLQTDDDIASITFDWVMGLSHANLHIVCAYGSTYLDKPWGNWTNTAWSKAGTNTSSGTDTITFPAGTRVIAFCLYSSGAITNLAADGLAQLTNVSVLMGTAGDTVADMLCTAAVRTGLAVSSAQTDNAFGGGGAPLHCMIAPFTTVADALSTIEAMGNHPIGWGFWDDAQFRTTCLLTDPAAIRALPNCYLIDSELAGIEYDVHAHAEGLPEYVRCLYGYRFSNQVVPASPSGNTMPTSPPWYWSSANVTAVSGQFKLLANAGDWQPYVLYEVEADAGSMYAAGCNFAMHLAAGSTAWLIVTVTWYDSGYGFISSEDACSNDIGAAANSLTIGKIVAPAGAVFARLSVNLVGDMVHSGDYVYVSNIRLGLSLPEGIPVTLIREAPGVAGDRGANLDARVELLDLSGQNLTMAQAASTVDRGLLWASSLTEQGGIGIELPTVPVYAGGTKVTPYIRAGDYIENSRVTQNPILITGMSCDVQSGAVALEITPGQNVYRTPFAKTQQAARYNVAKLRRWMLKVKMQRQYLRQHHLKNLSEGRRYWDQTHSYKHTEFVLGSTTKTHVVTRHTPRPWWLS
jgi:hypothetical protein